jgi:two-component system, OmpR family, sensor kinase
MRKLLPRSLQARLLLTYLAVLLLGLGGLIAWTGGRLQEATLDRAEHDLSLQAQLIANALREPLEHPLDGGDFGGYQGRSLDTLVQSYAAGTAGRVTILDAQNMVMNSSDNRVPTHREENHPEIVAARIDAEVRDIRWDEWRNEERMFVAAPIVADRGQGQWTIQLSIPMAPLSAEIQGTWLSLLVGGGAILVAAALASLLLARQIAGPIHSLTVSTEAMAAGDLDHQVQPAGPDEIERLGRSFNRMGLRVKDMLARQQAFVADAAHELRSPLASLRLRLELAQSRQPQSNVADLDVPQMRRDVERLQRITDHLLALAALDEGEQLPRTPLDLAPLLYELADDLSPQAQRAGLSVQIDVPPHLPPVQANADQMRIVVRNLLDNAVKYTPTGGRITLSACSDKGSLHVAVSDTGVGIPEDALPHIFERFYRADKARSRQHGGAGLGLALVRSIVESHGGDVRVESRLGNGTMFTIHLPLGA